MSGRPRPMRPSGAGALLAIAVAWLAGSGCGADSVPAQPTEWRSGTGHRWRSLALPSRGATGFRALPASRTGISFENVLTDSGLLNNQILGNGSGVAIGDVNGDGLADVYLARLEGPNALYLNRGDWRFEEAAGAAGVAAPDRFSTGAVLADADGDGDLDLLLTALGGPNALFLNDGSGTFRDATEASGLASGRGATTLALADADGDGDLDLYVTNYKRASVLDLYPPEERTLSRTIRRAGDSVAVAPEFEDHYELVWEGPEPRRYELGEPDRFYLNDGAGRFEPVSFTSGRFLEADGRPLAEEPRDWGLSAAFRDLDGDRDPDLYVCNDFQSPDRIWINDGAGVFRAVSPLAVRTTSATCMDVETSDVDLDGDLDLFTLDMLSRDPRRRREQVPVLPYTPAFPGEVETVQQVPRNALLLSRGDGTYAEAANYAGVAASEWSWATLFMDVDLDGDEDILITNGQILDFMHADMQPRVQEAYLEDWRSGRFLYPELRTRNVAFRNDGELRFTETGDGWGFAPAADMSHGMAAGDLDGDGDLDVVVNRLGDPALVLRNESVAPRLAVRLEGRPPNTRGVGAVIRVEGGPVPEQRKEVTAGGTYLSGSQATYAFAAGESDELRIAVEWRSGARSRIEGARPNRLYVVREPGREEAATVASDPVAAGSPAPEPAPLFEEVELDHLHLETAYDDFERQALLPLRLSQLGPGVAWQDVDADGDADLLIGSGRGGKLSMFRNDDGRLRRVVLRMPAADLDQTTVLGLPAAGGGSALLVGQMNYEAADPERARRAPSVLRLDLEPTSPEEDEAEVAVSPAVPGLESATGPLAMADTDGDGDLDLFVGGRTIPAAYPAPATSRLFLGGPGGFERDARNRATLDALGLVSSAVFSDVDGDGDPDLLVALEWGPIKLFRNDGGRFVDRTAEWGLSAATNRWNGITAGDLDGDGRLDVVATAWGLNTGLPASPENPLRLYYGDFDANGTVDVLQAAREGHVSGYAPLTDFRRLTRALPYVRDRIDGFSAYGRSTVREVLGPAFAGAEVLEVRRLDHVLFLNRGDRFEPIPLPAEAQLAPAFHAAVADADGDGHEDVFLSQNFYATDPGTARYDAGRGLWLRGDGTGRLQAVPGELSGIRVYGEQRGAALSDYDGDGRVDLVVSQNGRPAVLFRNRGARPGLRVRVVGPAGNPHAVGAALRIVYEARRGPVREIRSGSGYWSQDDPVQVLGVDAAPVAVWVRWPGGEETERPVPPGAREVTVRRSARPQPARASP